VIHFLVAGGMALSIMTAPFGPHLAAPPTENMTIQIVTVNGSGCSEGTTALAVSDDNTAFTLTYSDFLAQVGVGARPTDFRKNCQLNLKVQVPQGFSYAIARVDYRGFAYLADGAIGTEKASYYFTGMPQTGDQIHSFPGPLTDNWQVSDTTPLAALVWSPCGELRNLNINTELRVYAGTSDLTTTTSFMNMDSTDVEISTMYHFAWKQCPAT